jgi:UDP:flavonoid glycosyltransferase YjiC (YdhE family)
VATIVFFPEGAYGPTNNCVGIGDVLRRRGHRVVFIVEESFAGTLAAQGFEERLMRLTLPPLEEEVPGQFWKDFIRDTAPAFRLPTIQQLAGFIVPTFQALVDGAKFVDDRWQQHRYRSALLWQADGRAAPFLGPVRQRSARP